MTRFARAKGSKASNERVTEDATPWSTLKQQLLDNLNNEKNSPNDINDQKIANYQKFIKEKEEEERKHVVWASFPVQENKSLLLNKQSKRNQKKKLISAEKNNNLDANTHQEVKIIKKKKLKIVSAVEIKNKSDKFKNSLINPDSEIGYKANQVKKNRLINLESSQEESSDVNIVNQKIAEQAVHVEKTESIKSKDKKHKKRKSEKESRVIGTKKLKTDNVENLKKVKKQNNLTQADLKKIERKKQKKLKQLLKKKEFKQKSEQKKLQLSADVSVETNTVEETEESIKTNETEISRADNEKVNNKKVFKQDIMLKMKKEKRLNGEHKRRKPTLPYKMFINGKELEIAYIEGFPVKKDDAERLKKLRKELISKGLPRGEIDLALKLERRKAEKALAREKKKVLE